MPTLSATAAEVETTEMAETASASETALPKSVKVIGFLVIFTVACGGTAYVVMRPSLKKLKEAKQQAAAKAETKSEE